MVSLPTSLAGLALGAGALIGLGAIGLGALAAAPSPRMTGGSLCTAGETPIFTCPLGAKRVSICGWGKQAVYRYGTPGKVELASTRLTLAQRAFSGGGETQIQMVSKDYSYILFDKTSRTGFGGDGRNDPESRSGLLVRRVGRTILEKECDDDAPIPTRAGTFIPSGGTIVAH